MAAPQADGFADLLNRAGIERSIAEDALFEVMVEQQEPRLLQPGARRQELGEHILAATVLLQHLAEAADLALNASQAVLELLAVVPFHSCLQRC